MRNTHGDTTLSSRIKRSFTFFTFSLEYLGYLGLSGPVATWQHGATKAAKNNFVRTMPVQEEERLEDFQLCLCLCLCVWGWGAHSSLLALPSRFQHSIQSIHTRHSFLLDCFLHLHLLPLPILDT